MKFTESKVSSLMGHTEVRFVEEEKKEFAIVASPMGMVFEGTSPPVENRAELNELAKTIGMAWNRHLDLKPKLLRPHHQ